MEVNCNWFLDRMFRNQSCHFGEILTLLFVVFLLVDISLLLPVLAFFSSHCKTIKRNYGKLQPIHIKYDRYFRRDSVPLMSHKKLHTKQIQKPNITSLPESLGDMLEFWNIARGLLIQCCCSPTMPKYSVTLIKQGSKMGWLTWHTVGLGQSCKPNFFRSVGVRSRVERGGGGSVIPLPLLSALFQFFLLRWWLKFTVIVAVSAIYLQSEYCGCMKLTYS